MEIFPWLVILAFGLIVLLRTGALSRAWNYLRREERPMTIDELETKLDPNSESKARFELPPDPFETESTGDDLEDEDLFAGHR